MIAFTDSITPRFLSDNLSVMPIGVFFIHLFNLLKSMTLLEDKLLNNFAERYPLSQKAFPHKFRRKVFIFSRIFKPRTHVIDTSLVRRQCRHMI